MEEFFEKYKFSSFDIVDGAIIPRHRGDLSKRVYLSDIIDESIYSVSIHGIVAITISYICKFGVTMETKFDTHGSGTSDFINSIEKYLNNGDPDFEDKLIKINDMLNDRQNSFLDTPHNFSSYVKRATN
jgi:hypothetical protein